MNRKQAHVAQSLNAGAAAVWKSTAPARRPQAAQAATAYGSPIGLPEWGDEVSWPSQCERLALLNQ
jgi:hypothetical protein